MGADFDEILREAERIRRAADDLESVGLTPAQIRIAADTIQRSVRMIKELTDDAERAFRREHEKARARR